MESLSRPLHRRKLSNATIFAGKNAYDGVFSGHRPNYAGAPAAKVEDYREIFSSAQSASSIPVLDLPTLEESSGGSHLELGSSKPDYGRIFGGFCEEDVAVSYEVLLARDKDRVSSSTSPSSQDLDDSSHQPSDALKQFNMSYHKINQRNKDGLDGKTHVTQLRAIPGFTCFIDETAPPQKETKKQNPSVINNNHPNVDSKNEDLPEKQTSESAVKSRSKDCQDESLSDDKINKRFEVDPKSNASKVSSPPVDNHKDYQKRSTDVNSGTSKSDTCEEFSFTYFDEEPDVNSAAAASSAALKKAIEKAQESIRIAKESVGRKKEGLRSFTSRSFKDSLKVKARPENISEEQKRKDNEVGRNHKYGGLGVFSDFMNSEKLFGAKKVINEIHVKVSESAKKSEIPISSSHEVCDSKEVSGETEATNLDSDGKYEHATLSSEPVENYTYETPNEDEAYAQRPKGFLEIESLEKKQEETEDVIKDDEPRELKENKYEVILSNARKLVEESNNLTVYLEVEDETKISHKLNKEMGLLENEKQEVLEQEDVEKVENDEASDNGVENENELKEEDETDKEEDTGEKFYDVYEPETNEILQINAYSLEKSEVSPKKKENHEMWETLDEVAELDINENSSSDYDDAEESESACNIVTDTEETREEVDEFQVEFEKISLDQTASEENEDDREEKDDDMSNCGFADMDFKQNETEQNDVQSESSSDTINGMEIEVNELKERNEMEKDEIPEIRENEPIKEVEKDDHKRIEEREREKNKLAVERAIREARERAFAEARERAERATVERVNAEVRERVMADAREKVAKASVGTKLSDRTSELAKLRAERAAVERATSEARQRALEKAMSQKNVSDRTSVSHDLNTSNGTESAQRSKAKLEKHNRIMERAAKALAEKEKRDMLVQKEQAERNRLAENLDADIKRWSSGKEGNLRALLSTLQYILGADSGWQPVPLTEIITNSAVKKAYRKATLCVHPDKLQQRGASIQQKYICEKVFDLLKAAWNRFNSEER